MGVIGLFVCVGIVFFLYVGKWLLRVVVYGEGVVGGFFEMNIYGVEWCCGRRNVLD